MPERAAPEPTEAASNNFEPTAPEPGDVEPTAPEPGDVEPTAPEPVDLEPTAPEPVEPARALTPRQLEESIALAKAALDEIAEFKAIGDFHEALPEQDGVYSLRFVSNAPGFRDWWWTVSMTHAPGAEAPTVLECGLLPGEDALLAPEWVPWAKRLAHFRATHDSHGNPLPEPEDEREDGPEEGREDEAGNASQPARTRTRKRTRTRLRRRGDSAKAAEQGTDRATEQATQQAPGQDTGAAAAAGDAVSDGASATSADADPQQDASDALPVAPDIRDFAEEMDEALDGVTFEEDDPEEDDSEEDEIEEDDTAQDDTAQDDDAQDDTAQDDDVEAGAERAQPRRD